MNIVILLILLFILTVNDLKHKKIPNKFILISFLTGILINILGLTEKTVFKALIDFVIVFIPLIFLWSISTLMSFKVLFAGDIKTLSLLPLFMSLEDTRLVILTAILISAFFGIFYTNFSNLRESLKDVKLFLCYGIPGPENAAYQTKIAFVPFIFLAVFGFYIYHFSLG